ncbi:MAG: carotenoid biosynthesis protein [Candidatus Bathyarchaeota archaeon]|nr:carotenoid biosynthesis protein [Candidatus Bathyarchaeota archaeon]MDH5732444.1 carotenoid biosynthesis protein [Candidatus Bathyarchaeota archaeon]
MKRQFTLDKKRFLVVNAIFAITALVIEWTGITLGMYVYADNLFNIFDVPITIIVSWIVIGHTSWVVYKKFGWIAGLLTGIIIDLPLEFLAFHLGWWTWIPRWTPAIFFNAPAINFVVFLSVSLGSILTYNYLLETKL